MVSRKQIEPACVDMSTMYTRWQNGRGNITAGNVCDSKSRLDGTSTHATIIWVDMRSPSVASIANPVSIFTGISITVTKSLLDSNGILVVDTFA
jgi:hypothetical protein